MTRADIPTSYDEAVGLVGGANGRKTICNNTVVEVSKPMNTAYYGGQGLAYVLLHGHNVVAFREDGSVRIDSCGWRTVTTKDRINRCLGSRGSVFQKNHEWFYRARYGMVIPFRDGLVVDVSE